MDECKKFDFIVVGGGIAGISAIEQVERFKNIFPTIKNDIALDCIITFYFYVAY